MGKRDSVLDVARGLAMLCVIYNHASAVTGTAFISRFHVPVFFILSGITMAWEKEHQILALCKKKLKAFMIPYCVWGRLSEN